MFLTDTFIPKEATYALCRCGHGAQSRRSTRLSCEHTLCITLEEVVLPMDAAHLNCSGWINNGPARLTRRHWTRPSSKHRILCSARAPCLRAQGPTRCHQALRPSQTRSASIPANVIAQGPEKDGDGHGPPTKAAGIRTMHVINLEMPTFFIGK